MLQSCLFHLQITTDPGWDTSPTADSLTSAETMYYDAMSQCDWTGSHYERHGAPYPGHHTPSPGEPHHYHPHYHHHHPPHHQYHQPEACCVVTPPAPHAPYCQTQYCVHHPYSTPPSTPQRSRHSFTYGYAHHSSFSLCPPHAHTHTNMSSSFRFLIFSGYRLCSLDQQTWTSDFDSVIVNWQGMSEDSTTHIAVIAFTGEWLRKGTICACRHFFPTRSFHAKWAVCTCKSIFVVH